MGTSGGREKERGRRQAGRAAHSRPRPPRSAAARGSAPSDFCREGVVVELDPFHLSGELDERHGEERGHLQHVEQLRPPLLLRLGERAVELLGDGSERLHLVEAKVHPLLLELLELLRDARLQVGHRLERVDAGVVHAEAPHDVYGPVGAADVAEHLVVLQHALQLDPVHHDGAPVLVHGVRWRLLVRHQATVRRPVRNREGPLASVVSLVVLRGHAGIDGQQRVGAIPRDRVRVLEHPSLLEPGDLLLPHPLLRAVEEGLHLAALLQVPLRERLREGGQGHLLLVFVALVLLQFLTDEPDALQRVEVGPQEDRRGRAPPALHDLRHEEAAHGVGVHNDRHERIQEEERNHDDVNEHQYRSEQVVVGEDGVQVHPPCRRHHDGDERTAQRGEKVRLSTVRGVEGHRKASHDHAQQAGEEQQVVDAALDDAHEGVEHVDERQVLQDAQPAQQAQARQHPLGELQGGHQAACGKEHLGVRDVLWLQVRLRAGVCEHVQVDTQQYDEQRQDDQVADRPEVLEEADTVLPQQPHYVREEEQLHPARQ
mmetsp:Transcript_87311/g.247313  ORF Transcript_87311/g.247313 Transcript_87311/m.247313 type:complete len:543 (+) Transcript_87311:1-1629(+)